MSLSWRQHFDWHWTINVEAEAFMSETSNIFKKIAGLTACWFVRAQTLRLMGQGGLHFHRQAVEATGVTDMRGSLDLSCPPPAVIVPTSRVT